MRIYDFVCYKEFINNYIISLPKRGRGKFQSIAYALNVHSTLISQIFRGPKDLTLEQADSLCNYLALDDKEIDFFLLLVQYSRAGTKSLQDFLFKQIKKKQIKYQELIKRLKDLKELDQQDKAIFYSSWEYSAIRLLTSIKSYQNVESISNYLGISEIKTRQILDFLISRNLCKEDDSKISMGPAITHLGASSPFVSNHHTNWRKKSMERHGRVSTEEIIFTAPLTISKDDSMEVRKMIVEFIEKLQTLVKDSNSENLFCIGIDWTKI